MSLIPLDVAMTHCKAEQDDGVQVQKCIDTAEKRAARIMQRNIYADQAALDAAIAAAPAALVAANAAYAAAMSAAASSGTPEDQADAEAAAATRLRRTKVDISYATDGIVITDDIYGAILLLTDHFYINRGAVLTHQGATALPLPQGVEDILGSYRLPGEL